MTIFLDNEQVQHWLQWLVNPFLLLFFSKTGENVRERDRTVIFPHKFLVSRSTNQEEN